MTVFDVPYQFGQKNLSYKPFRLTVRQQRMLKRAFDLAFCLFLMPVLLVPAALIAFIIVLDSPGSPIFVQERIGYRGRRFKMYKFRTMWKDHDAGQHRSFMQTFVSGGTPGLIEGDARVAKFKPIHEKDLTRFGRWLRKASLDELPQLLNILKGDMSLIGPRPNVPWEVEAYKPWHYDRLDVLPGITGLAQVMGRSDISFDAIARYDIQYARNQALHLDFWIAWKTFSVILAGKGAG